MPKTRHHQLDIYGAWLHATTTHQGWRALRAKVPDLPDIEDGSLGFTSREVTEDGAVHLCVFIDAPRLVHNPAGLTEILAHEATHASCMLLDHIGQSYDGESEALAYLLGFIAAWLWEASTAA